MAPKPYFRAIFPIFRLFFSYFLGEAVFDIFPISHSGRRPETYSVAGQRGLKTKGRKKHINFFNINFLAPTQNPPIWGPQKKVDVPHFLGKSVKKGPT